MDSIQESRDLWEAINAVNRTMYSFDEGTNEWNNLDSIRKQLFGVGLRVWLDAFIDYV